MRQRQLVELISLLIGGEYVTADKLSALIHMSPKTIRLRLKSAADEVKQHGGAIESKPRYGYRLVIVNPVAFYSWYGDGVKTPF